MDAISRMRPASTVFNSALEQHSEELPESKELLEEEEEEDQEGWPLQVGSATLV